MEKKLKQNLKLLIIYKNMNNVQMKKNIPEDKTVTKAKF